MDDIFLGFCLALAVVIVGVSLFAVGQINACEAHNPGFECAWPGPGQVVE